MISIDFRWEVTEENFRRMMAEEQTTDIFGSLRFADYLVEFRCAGSGYDDDYHVPVTDIYIYGEEGIEEYALANGVPYRLLDEEIIVPKRRTLESFKRRVQAIVYEKLGDGESELCDELVYKPTRSHQDWNPQKKEPLPIAEPEIRVPTDIGTIVVVSKGDYVGYPGVWVGLERKGKRFDVAMVEVDQDPYDEPNDLLKVHVYCTDPAHDDPIYAYTTDAAEIDKYNDAMNG